MLPIIHNYTDSAGQTRFWDFGDTQEQFEKNCSDPIRREQLKKLGYLDTDIVYRFNSHGFRGPEFVNRPDIVCFGCSFTMGTGVREEHTWPSQLAHITGKSVINLGHAGSSNDTAFRFANHYLEHLKPRYAVWLQTDSHRIELIDQASNTVLNLLYSYLGPCEKDYFLKIWFSSEENQKLNRIKNTLSFEKLCDKLGIVPIVLERSLTNFADRARDLSHPGINTYRELAETISQHIV